MSRKIPATMVSQHPDHAGKPFWHNEEFINTTHEVEECFLSFSELGVSEYKWDWEGKLVDEAVMERLLSGHYEYFKNMPLGHEKFLTFRLPNPKVETEFRLGRAFMGLLSAAQLAKQVGLHSPPLFEVILPMTQSADDLLDIHEAFSEISALKHKLYNFVNGNLKHIELIPLFEDVNTIINSDSLLKEYIQKHSERYKFKPLYLRPYIARSDPALNSGLVPTMLALKIALSRYETLGEKTEIKLFPIVGTGSLPFRGGLDPDSVDDFIAEYKGIKTALLQSAFRYDFPKGEVINAIRKLERELPESRAVAITYKDELKLLIAIGKFEEYYRSTIGGISFLVNTIASYLPKRRERVQHVGLFGYSRGVGGVRLPRAIGFTGALYSIGIPPELIGTGRGIKKIKKLSLLSTVEKYYVNIKPDLIKAGRYLNKSVLTDLAKKDEAWKMISEDVKQVEKYLGYKLNPTNKNEFRYQRLTDRIYDQVKKGKVPFDDIKQAALIRKSLG